MEVEQRWVSNKNDWQTIEDYILFLKQAKAYEFAKTHCSGKNILDYGCGSGYGTLTLSETANKITGVDISQEVIDYCDKKYKKYNLSFEMILPDTLLPFGDGMFDVIVSFQVIEHVNNVSYYLYELNRNLKDNGKLIITTPNRRYRLWPFEKPCSLGHKREFNYNILRKKLCSTFKTVTMVGLHASDEVYSIELKRVYRSPFSHLAGYLPKYISSFLRKLKHNNIHYQSAMVQKTKKDNLITKYSLNDFSVGKYTHECLDLLAICQK
jgi:ubiquinone/menaquinone biosynthesis C-methylase UbiE